MTQGSQSTTSCAGGGVDEDTLMTLSGKPGEGTPVSPSREATSGESPDGKDSTQRREGLPGSVSDDPDGTRTSRFNSDPPATARRQR